MQQARDAELAAKEAAFNRRKKAEAAQRGRQVAEAQREVAAIFKANQEKELRDRLEREAKEKAKYKRLAKEVSGAAASRTAVAVQHDAAPLHAPPLTHSHPLPLNPTHRLWRRLRRIIEGRGRRRG